METIWREKCIGEIIGGYLQDCYVFIYNTHNVAIVKNRKIICYVNGDTVIEYSDKSQVQKKSIGGSLVGSMIFGTPGALAYGNKNEFILEITWSNMEKSLVKIDGDKFYAFFISKLYEKTPKEEKSEKEILEEKKELIDNSIKSCNSKLKNESLSTAISELVQTIPYYRFKFNNCDIDDYDDEILKFSDDIKEYEEFLKNNTFDDNYDNYILKKYSAIGKMKLIKSGNMFAKSLYENDEEVKNVSNNEYEKYKDYDYDDFKKLMKVELQDRTYQEFKSLHEENGYVCFSNDNDILQEQLLDLKGKLPSEIYSFLLKISKISEDELESKYGFTAYGIISKIVNYFYGKDSFDVNVLQIIQVSPSVKKYLDKLIEIGDDRVAEDAYFSSLDSDEHNDYFDAYDIYVNKCILDENIKIEVNDNINDKNKIQKEKSDVNNLLNGKNLINKTDTYKLLKDDKRCKVIENYLKANDSKVVLKSYCPLKTGGIIIANSYTAYYLKCDNIPNAKVSFSNDWTKDEKQNFIKNNMISESLINHEIYPDAKMYFDGFIEEDTILFSKKEILEQAKSKVEYISYKSEHGNEVNLDPEFLNTTIKILDINNDTFIGKVCGFKVFIINDKEEVALIMTIRKY